MSANRCVVLLVLLFGLFASACKEDLTADAGPDGGHAKPDDASQVNMGPPCKTDADCDDQLFCDGVETCEHGACVAGTAMTCSDGIACTIDQCSERKQACESLPPDLDGDGHYDATCKGKDGKSVGDDCDDDDPLRFPGNIESCDAANKDEDCDPTTFGDKDSDDDGFMDGTCCNAVSDKQGAALHCGDDCDDLKPSVNPNAAELCDLFDNDCDGTADEGVSQKMYADDDHDGHGAMGKAVMKCAGSVGFAPESNDCDDHDPEVFKGQFEICDKKDNNCNGKVDEVHDDAPWFTDVDKDGFGDATSTPIYSCERIPGRVLSNNDCDDAKPAINPAAAEACDAVDNDCNGKKDFRLGNNNFEDDDNDGIADAKCGAGGEDCADTDPTSGKGLEEVCDTRDNDCDEAIDEDTAQTVWYLDRDGDGWGVDQGTALARCEPIPGRAANLGDCDDEVNAIHPKALELCDGIDENCNGKIDEGTNYQCAMPGAVGYCKLGGCAVLSCYPGFDDCNKDAADGCECKVPVVPFQTGCSVDADCDDDDYCDGKERCVAGDCFHGTPINCDASESVLQGSFFIHNSLDIQMLAGIETITGDLIISASGLQNLTGLESLKTVGGNLVVDGNLDTSPDVFANQSLTALVGSGLINLTTVTGDVIIEDNPKLTVILLPSLVAVGGDLAIRRNDALAMLDGFDSLVRVTGDLAIQDNYALTKLTGMKLLAGAGALHINNNGLIKLSLPSLARVSGDFDPSLTAEANTALTTIDMPKLTQIDGSLYVRSLSELTKLSLPALKKVLGHDFFIQYNSKLVDLDLHSFVQFTSVNLPLGVEDQASFYVEYNSALATLENFGAFDCACHQCGGDFYSNAALSSCDIQTFVQSVTNIYIYWQSNLNSSGADGGMICTDGSNGS